MIGVPSEKWGETIKALVVKTEGSELTEQELIDYCKSKVARYKAPSSVEFREELARTATGKLQKFKLPQAVLGGPRPAGQLTPSDTLGPCRPWVTSSPCSTSWYPPAHRRRLGCRRPRLRRPRRRRTPDPAGRRPGARRSPTRRSRSAPAARHPPPAVPQGRARGRGHRPQGPGRAPAPGRRLRPVHRPHQRRRSGRRRLGVAGPGAGPRRSPARWSRTVDGSWTSSSSSRRWRRPNGSAPRWSGGAGHDRRLRLGLVHLRRRGPVPAARRRAPAIGTVGEVETVDEVRIEVVAPRSCAAACSRRCVAAHPYEEPAYDIIELASEEDRDAGSGRIGRLSEPIDLAGVRSAGGRGAAGDRARCAGRG